MELVCLGRISYVIPFQDLVLIYCKKDIDLSMLNYNLDLYYSFNVFKDGSCMHYREPMITTYDYYEIVVISPCQPSLWWNKSTYQTLPSPSSSSISKKESGQVVRSHLTTSHMHSPRPENYKLLHMHLCIHKECFPQVSCFYHKVKCYPRD